MTAVLQIESLTKQYGKVTGIRDLTLAVAEGEIFGFLGPNGAGKTTTIKLVCGFLRPTRGRALVFGHDSWTDGIRARRDIGLVPDAAAFNEGMTGQDVLDYLARLQRRPPALQHEVRDRLELSQRDLARKVRGYSRGMRQKLALIQGMQHDPALLVMDEPTEGLDPLVRESLFDLLQERQARGRTTFFSSHNLPEVERLCQRVGIVRKAELVALEEIAALRQKRLRRMDATFRDDVPDAAFAIPSITRVERQGRAVSLWVKGDVNPVLQLLARHPVDNFVFEETMLEDIFLEYYGSVE